MMSGWAELERKGIACFQCPLFPVPRPPFFSRPSKFSSNPQACPTSPGSSCGPFLFTSSSSSSSLTGDGVFPSNSLIPYSEIFVGVSTPLRPLFFFSWRPGISIHHQHPYSTAALRTRDQHSHYRISSQYGHRDDAPSFIRQSPPTRTLSDRSYRSASKPFYPSLYLPVHLDVYPRVDMGTPWNGLINDKLKPYWQFSHPNPHSRLLLMRLVRGCRFPFHCEITSAT